VRTTRAKKIRCYDLPGPGGPYAVFSDGLRPLDDPATLEAVAQNGMMLSLDPAYAKRLIANGRLELLAGRARVAS
jgi:hypothetical protein